MVLRLVNVGCYNYYGFILSYVADPILSNMMITMQWYTRTGRFVVRVQHMKLFSAFTFDAGIAV